MREPFQRRERSPASSACVRCLQERENRELDRLLWCEECVARARARAGRRAWFGGVAIALGVALYVLYEVRPDLSLIPAAWGATVLVAVYLGYRISRELLFGWERLRNRPAVEAKPPRS